MNNFEDFLNEYHVNNDDELSSHDLSMMGIWINGFIEKNNFGREDFFLSSDFTIENDKIIHIKYRHPMSGLDILFENEIPYKVVVEVENAELYNVRIQIHKAQDLNVKNIPEIVANLTIMNCIINKNCDLSHLKNLKNLEIRNTACFADKFIAPDVEINNIMLYAIKGMHKVSIKNCKFVDISSMYMLKELQINGKKCVISLSSLTSLTTLKIPKDIQTLALTNCSSLETIRPDLNCDILHIFTDNKKLSFTKPKIKIRKSFSKSLNKEELTDIEKIFAELGNNEDLIKSWLGSGLDIETFKQVHRGSVKAIKYNI